MKKNILKFPALATSSALQRYDKAHDPSDYLYAIEEAFSKRSALAPLADRLPEFIESIKAKENRRSLFGKACKLLAKLRFTPISKSVSEPEHSKAPEFSERAKASMQSLIETLAKADTLRRQIDDLGASTPYSAFPPAYSYAETIPKVFPKHDPVKKVCEYLNELQPKEPFHHADDCWFNDDERITINPEEHAFFLGQILPQLLQRQNIVEDGVTQPDIALWIIVIALNGYFAGNLTPNVEKHPIFDFRLPVGKTLDDLSASEKAELMQSFMRGIVSFNGFLMLFFGEHCALPQGLFAAVLRYWVDCKICIGSDENSRSIIRSLANYPLGRPAQSWEEIERGAADPAWPKKMKEIYTEPADVPFLPCRMSEGDWFYPLSDAALPIEFWLNNHAKYYGNVLDAWSRKIGILRNSQLGGRYPWRAWADTCYLYHDSVLSNPDWDTHSHLLALLVEDDQSASYGWEGDIYGDNYANGYRSFQLHRNFWLAADREGYPELGNAMLAFYLLCKSLRDADEHPHLEVDWALFPGVLRMALTRPGHDYVRQAVEFMKAICSEKGWNLDLLRLKNVVPDSGATTSFPKSTSVQIVEPVGAIVAREIERLVGSEDWKKLSNRSRKLLVEAETRFRNITQTIGAGITEFGPETLAYARCFENELHERLRDIYCSPAMVTFWEREYPKRPLNMHPTLGSYIKLLESDLPADISKMIEAAGVRLHMNRDLLRRLHVLQARRNEGGHTSRNVAAEQLHRQRGAIFEERLLNEFLSALSPCAST